MSYNDLPDRYSQVHVPAQPLTLFLIAIALAALAAVIALRRHPSWGLLLKLIAGGALAGCMVIEGSTPTHPGSSTVSMAAAVLWWVVLAWFLAGLARWLAWRGTDAVHQVRARKLVVELVAAAAWGVALVAVAGLLFDQPVTGMIATSGIVAIVMGLALQNTLADLFAGVALNVERPFRAGDWITFDGTEGLVVETNWRATHIRNRLGDLVIVPNGSIAKARIVNHALPARLSVLVVKVGLPYEIKPDDGIAVLREAAVATPRTTPTPAPVILIDKLDDSAVLYAVCVFIEDFAILPAVRSDLLANILTHTAARGIALATPRQEIVLRPDLAPAAN
ncbi:mechanosensitive ion channel family protein [Roseiterribacter gracilis]|uniref:Small-conductance mechanosensitive channel n=1 Tax=Roseiterribacter gracilis TaxID=2812848 RepID=A0A8S8X6W7_9PROT|nr:hypothetical protein TMPK1_09600 [Rhodospirillales bacterium TMPK1]